MRYWGYNLFADRTEISTVIVPVVKSMPLLNPKFAFFCNLASFCRRIRKNSKIMNDAHESIFNHICIIVKPQMSSYNCSKSIIIIKLVMKSILI